MNPTEKFLTDENAYIKAGTIIQRLVDNHDRYIKVSDLLDDFLLADKIYDVPWTLNSILTHICLQETHDIDAETANRQEVLDVALDNLESAKESVSEFITKQEQVNIWTDFIDYINNLQKTEETNKTSCDTCIKQNTCWASGKMHGKCPKHVPKCDIEEDEIRIGDEIICPNTTIKAVVFNILHYDNITYYQCFDSNGNLVTENDANYKIIKTGRHFSQVGELLKHIREESGK